MEKESDKLMKQIAIFESHAQDNFEKMDNYFDNIVGFWEGRNKNEFLSYFFLLKLKFKN